MLLSRLDGDVEAPARFLCVALAESTDVAHDLGRAVPLRERVQLDRCAAGIHPLALVTLEEVRARVVLTPAPHGERGRIYEAIIHPDNEARKLWQ